MDRLISIILISLIAVVLFGCVSQGPSPPVNDSAQVGAGEQTSNITNISQSSNTSVHANVSAGSDLSGLGYEALIALGLPIQCDITTTSGETTMKIKLYMNGKTHMREEIEGISPTCTGNTVVIIAENAMDIGCSTGQVFSGCDWLHYPINMSADESAGAADQSQTPDLTDLPPTQFSCSPWIPDQSKFVASGKVCDLSDLMGGLNASGITG
jgi:hypothetical protein